MFVRYFAFPLALFVALAAPEVAQSQAPLLNGLGGPAGFGTGELAENDDGSSQEISLASAFPNGLDFFGAHYSSMFVNNNGSITFGGAVGSYTPARFPITGQRMIAPFWADVDTRGGGRPRRNGVYWDVRPGQVTITWYRVGYYNSHSDRLNSFQLIIRSNEELSADRVWLVEFRYNECTWTTGDASGGGGGTGGTPAQAGFDAGDGSHFLILPGSGTRRVLSLCSESNVEERGVWQYTIQEGRPLGSN